ncbi:DUF5683 domain-containing protein [Pedobacter deserti]|uniref:DUF5683 domain-containing protein n=1 Tax=Pedobacter deserti TaxID=2817382 RepID=UPI00210A5CAA|nr:DUF5683 domain-containing protein [Pedobacter sp. SYSU D00382]
MRTVVLLCILMFGALMAGAQDPVSPVVKDSTVKSTDTVRKKAAYVNPGKIAGRKAAFRSMMVPGLGQIGNGITVYRLVKVAGIYTGATMLTLSYIDNNKSYKEVLAELQYRAENGGKATTTGRYRNYPSEGLIPAKDTFRRNREVVIFSLAGLYLLNIVEAYIDARLKYFNVDDIAIKVAPDMINASPVYGLTKPAPGIKLTFNF